VAQKLLALLPKEGGVLMQTMAEEWIEEGKRIGLQEERQYGRERQRTMILRVLQRRFQPKEESLQSVVHQLAQITDEETLIDLVDIAMEVIMLSDFRMRLQELLAEAATEAKR
jgi:hypothetical protein